METLTRRAEKFKCTTGGNARNGRVGSYADRFGHARHARVSGTVGGKAVVDDALGRGACARSSGERAVRARGHDVDTLVAHDAHHAGADQGDAENAVW
jgi:hypothetical protein